MLFALAFSPDGKSLAVGSPQGQIFLWSVQRPSSPRLSLRLPGQRGLGSIVFDPRGQRLASSSVGPRSHRRDLGPRPDPPGAGPPRLRRVTSPRRRSSSIFSDLLLHSFGRLSERGRLEDQAAAKDPGNRARVGDGVEWVRIQQSDGEARAIHHDHAVDLQPRHGDPGLAVSVLERQRLAAGLEGDPRRCLRRPDRDRGAVRPAGSSRGSGRSHRHAGPRY